MDKYDFFRRNLEKRKGHSRFRMLRNFVPKPGGEVIENGKRFLNFSSNDYLGLSFNKDILDAGYKAAEKYGNGTGGSRLVTGANPIFFELEEKIAKFKGKEKAIVLNTGYQANFSIISAIATRNSIIFSDSLNHNSIIKGAVASRARLKRFRHNDMDDLERSLKQSESEKVSTRLIVTESVFSMDGDVSDISVLRRLADEYNAILIVDDAHATGVLGQDGKGLGQDADIIIGTFGKGLGVFGAYVACSNLIYDYLVNFCEGLIFSTSLPPFVVGAVSKAIDLLPSMGMERKKLLNLSSKLRKGLNSMGYDTLLSSSQIVPVIVGDDKKTVELSRYIEDKGIIGIGIRPPTVPENMSRIRLGLSALHNESDIEMVLEVFDECREKFF